MNKLIPSSLVPKVRNLHQILILSMSMMALGAQIGCSPQGFTVDDKSAVAQSSHRIQTPAVQTQPKTQSTQPQEGRLPVLGDVQNLSNHNYLTSNALGLQISQEFIDADFQTKRIEMRLTLNYANRTSQRKLVGYFNTNGVAVLLEPSDGDRRVLLGIARCIDLCANVIVDIHFRLRDGSYYKKQYQSTVQNFQPDLSQLQDPQDPPTNDNDDQTPDPDEDAANLAHVEETDSVPGEFATPPIAVQQLDQMIQALDDDGPQQAPPSLPSEPTPQPQPSPTPAPEQTVKPPTQQPAPVVTQIPEVQPTPAPQPSQQPLPLPPQPPSQQPLPLPPPPPPTQTQPHPVTPPPPAAQQQQQVPPPQSSNGLFQQLFPTPPPAASAGAPAAPCNDLAQTSSVFPCSNLGPQYPGKAMGYYGNYNPANNTNPNPGSLVSGTQIAPQGVGFKSKRFDSPNYRLEFGAGITLKILEYMAEQFYRKVNDIIRIGDITQQRGGHTPPHVSHQNGLDVDVSMPKLANGRLDFEKAWELLKAAFATNLVHRVGTVQANKNEICRVAKQKGEFENNLNIFRNLSHWSGHDKHFHFRMKCTTHNGQTCRIDSSVINAVGCP